MKKHLMLTFLLSIWFLSSNVQALSWAYPFVVWDGSVYEVKQDEPLDDQNIGKEIGAVETKPDEMTGDHYGNASNYYEIGTPYAEIQGVSPTAAIAVKDMDVWVRGGICSQSAVSPNGPCYQSTVLGQSRFSCWNHLSYPSETSFYQEKLMDLIFKNIFYKEK